MNPFRFRTFLTVLMLCVNTGAQAQTAEVFPPDSRVLSVDVLVDAVLARNAGLSARKAAVEAAEARIEPAGSLPDPQLTLALAPETLDGFRTPSGSERSANGRLEISQALPWPGTLDLRARVARHEAAAAADDRNALRLRLIAATRSLYARWFYVHRALEVNAASQQLVDELRRVAENRYAAGLARQGDVLQAEVELQRIRHQAIQLQRLKREVRARINELVARPADEGIPQPDTLSVEAPVVPALPAPGSRQAILDHPELSGLQQRIDANLDREALARKEFYPDMKVFGGYNNLREAKENRWIIGINLTFPLDRSKRRSSLDAARADTHALKDELTDRRARLLSEIEQASAAVDEARQSIALYEDELLPRAREYLSATRTEYGAGGGSFLDVITAEQRKLNAELELARAHADHVSALAELKRWTTGERTRFDLD